MPPPKDPKKYEEWVKKQRERMIGEKNHQYGKHYSEQAKKKMSEAQKGEKSYQYGKHHSEETKKKMSEAQKGEKHPMYGKHPSEETRGKMSEVKKGEKNYFYNKHHSEQAKKKITEAKNGEKNPQYGKHRSDETRGKIREAQKGEKNHFYNKHHSVEIRKKMSKTRIGEKNPHWKGGISFEPYCPKFSMEFKERVREFFGRKCVVCGITESENHKKLHVHHVNYDKMVCCNGNTPLFIPLCNRCHPKTSNGDRDYWNHHFEELIMQKHDGKCYYTKEEMVLRHL